VVSRGPNSDPLIPYIKRDFKGQFRSPKCPRCGERMQFIRDGGSIPMWKCDEDKLVLSCSHHLNNALTGAWKKLHISNEGETSVVDGAGWL